MKIWIWNHYATQMFSDRAGRHYWFAKELRKKGHDVSVFCASTFHNQDRVIDIRRGVIAVKRAGGVPFVFVKTVKSMGNGPSRALNMSIFYKNLFVASKMYAKKYGRPDIILASSVHPLTMAAGIQIAKRMGIPCICEVRDLWPEALFRFGMLEEGSLAGRVLTAGEHWIYKKSDALVFTKEGDTDYLKEKQWTTDQGGDVTLSKCHYINNGVELCSYKKRVDEYALPDRDLDSGKFNVTYAGAIRPVNNVGNLLDAAKIISKRAGYGDVQFLIYGDGIELQGLKSRVEVEGIDNVRLKGFVGRRHIPYILSRSSVNILNYSQVQYNWSRGNSSNKLFEYMASGKPVISTVRTGYSIIEKYCCGVELEKDTPQALAAQIMRFHDMDRGERERIGQNARSGAKDFDTRVLAGKLEEVIRSVV